MRIEELTTAQRNAIAIHVNENLHDYTLDERDEETQEFELDLQKIATWIESLTEQDIANFGYDANSYGDTKEGYADQVFENITATLLFEQL